MSRLKVGVVGCGLVAQIAHIPNLVEMSDLFDIVAISTTSGSRLEALGRRYGISHQYLDYRKLLELDLDAVFVLTRDHADIALAAIDAGKSVFIEKPIAFNPTEAAQIISLARKRKVKLMVGYMRRFDPGFAAAREIIKDMGDHQLIRLHSSVGLPNRRVREMFDMIPGADPSTESAEAVKAREDEAMVQAVGIGNSDHLRLYSLLIHLWSHNINYLRAAFGQPQSIRYAEIESTSVDQGKPPCFQVLAVLDISPGKTCVWESRAFTVNENWDEELAVFGSERTLRLRFPFPYLKNTPALVQIEETSHGSFFNNRIETAFEDAFKRELKHFHQCLTTDTDPLTSGDDALADLQLAVDIIRQASGRRNTAGG